MILPKRIKEDAIEGVQLRQHVLPPAWDNSDAWLPIPACSLTHLRHQVGAWRSALPLQSLSWRSVMLELKMMQVTFTWERVHAR